MPERYLIWHANILIDSTASREIYVYESARERALSVGPADFDVGDVAPVVIRHFIVPKWPHSVINRRNQAGRYIYVLAVMPCVHACVHACMRVRHPACGLVRVEIDVSGSERKDRAATWMSERNEPGGGKG